MPLKRVSENVLFPGSLMLEHWPHHLNVLPPSGLSYSCAQSCPLCLPLPSPRPPLHGARQAFPTVTSLTPMSFLLIITSSDVVQKKVLGF